MKKIYVNKTLFISLIITCVLSIILSIAIAQSRTQIIKSRRLIIESNNAAMFILFIHELEDVIYYYNENEDGIYITEYNNDFRDISSLIFRFNLFEQHSEFVYNLYYRYSQDLTQEEYQELLNLKDNLEDVYQEYDSEIYKDVPSSYKDSTAKFNELVEKYD